MGLKASSWLAGRRAVLLRLLAAPIAAKAKAPAASAQRPTPGGPLYEQDFAAFDGKSLAQKVQELADREELRELIARYAHLIAQGRSVAELFTEDGAFIVHMPGKPVAVTRPRSALRELYRDLRPIDEAAKPMIHNYILEVTGDVARGVCSNEVRVAQEGVSLIGSGYYDDSFRRENGRWRFATREATFYHWVPLKDGWAKPLAR